MEREYKYIDVAKIHASELEPVDDTPENVLYESLLDVFQLAVAEGMAEEEVDAVIRRLVDYRATQRRRKLRVLGGGSGVGQVGVT